MSYIETSVINEYYCSIVDEQTGLDNLYSGITKLYNRVTDQDRMIHTLECALAGTLLRISQVTKEIEALKADNPSLTHKLNPSKSSTSNQSKNNSKEIEPELTPILSASNRKGKDSLRQPIGSVPSLSPIPVKPSPSKPPVSKVTNAKPTVTKVSKKKKPTITTKISITTKK